MKRWILAALLFALPTSANGESKCEHRIRQAPDRVFFECWDRYGDAIGETARLVGVGEDTLAGVLLVETWCRPLVGGLDDSMYGSSQVNLDDGYNRRLLAAHGIGADDLVTSVEAGIIATGYLWLRLLTLFGPMTDDRLVCVHGSGPIGLSWKSCEYSRCVRLAIERLRRIK